METKAQLFRIDNLLAKAAALPHSQVSELDVLQNRGTPIPIVTDTLHPKEYT